LDFDHHAQQQRKDGGAGCVFDDQNGGVAHSKSLKRPVPGGKCKVPRRVARFAAPIYPEFQSSNDERMTKPEIPMPNGFDPAGAFLPAGRLAGVLSHRLWASGFVFLSGFGFRISEFKFMPAAAARKQS
jgi:hypothetical protein